MFKGKTLTNRIPKIQNYTYPPNSGGIMHLYGTETILPKSEIDIKGISTKNYYTCCEPVKFVELETELFA